MIQTERECRLKTEYELLQITPAQGHVAVFRCGSSWFATPVVCWALAEICETSTSRPEGSRERFVPDGSDPCRYRQALPLVVAEEGSLEPAATCRGFIGVCRDDEDPAVLFEDEIGSDESVREGRMSVKYL